MAKSTKKAAQRKAVKKVTATAKPSLRSRARSAATKLKNAGARGLKKLKGSRKARIAAAAVVVAAGAAAAGLAARKRKKRRW